jgi:ribosomal protein S18 acetylase RimI-like enzyme
MTITRHPLRREADLPRIFELVRALPLTCRHVIDLPWRLSSLAIDEGRDAAFWENASGQIVGFAAWAQAWVSLDVFILPGTEQEEVEADLFSWAERRFRELDEEHGEPQSYWVDFYKDDHAKQQFLEAHGFQGSVDAYVFLQTMLTNLSALPVLPDGFTLRSLAGEQETATYAELHRAAFESNAMNPAWRARTLRMPQYRPELDLVISAPDGSLAGFCVGWFDPARQMAQIEPLGVHPRFHRLGLARVLLIEMLHRFKAHGANSALVETNLERTPARRAYEVVGFRQVNTVCFQHKKMI